MSAAAGEASVDGLGAAQLRWADVGGFRTRYFADGSGTPIVLISGGTFGTYCSLDAWSLNLPGLARGCRVYPLDKVGQGHSDAPRGARECVFDTAYHHAVAFLESVVGEPACVVGHSRAGRVAEWIALEHPELVQSLVIIDSLAPELPSFPVGRFYDALPDADAPPSPATVRVEPDLQAIRPG